MAVTAKFQADFSSFSDAVQKAEVELRSFESGAGKVESALTRMTNNFSGVKVIQDATLMSQAVDRIGGTSKLTEDELQKVATRAHEAVVKMTALGVEVPPHLQKLSAEMRNTGESTGFFATVMASAAEFATGLLAALSVERVVSFGLEAITAAGHIDDLALATGVSREALQRMAFVAEGFGIGMDEIARGVEQFSAKLAGGDSGAVSAVEKLGLKVNDLIRSGPAEAFLSFADAVGRVSDPMQKSALLADAFGGKLAKVLAPAIADLRKEMDSVPQRAIISDENIKKADEFDDGLKHLGTTLKALAVDAFAGGVKALGYWGGAAKEAREAQEKLTASTTEFVGPIQAAITNSELLANRLAALRADAVLPLTDAQKNAIALLDSFGVSHKEIAQLVETSEIAVKRYTDSLKEQEKAVKAAVEQYKQWDELLQHMDKETFALAQEHEKQWTLERLERLKLTNTAVLAEFDAETKLNAAWGLDAAGAIKLQSTALDDLNLKLAALHASKLEGITQEKQEQVLLQEYSKALYDQAVAQDKLAASVAVTTKGYYAQIDAMSIALGLISVGNRANAPGTGVNQGSNERGPGVNQGDTLPVNGVSSSSGKFTLPGFSLYGHKAGITNAPVGHWAMVGEDGPEPMYVPQGSTILPHGSNPGGAQTINLVVDGRVLASIVSDYQTRTAQQDRQFPA